MVSIFLKRFEGSSMLNLSSFNLENSDLSVPNHFLDMPMALSLNTQSAQFLVAVMLLP